MDYVFFLYYKGMANKQRDVLFYILSFNFQGMQAVKSHIPWLSQIKYGCWRQMDPFPWKSRENRRAVLSKTPSVTCALDTDFSI